MAGTEPRVPPARDPGGVPVAMIGPGIDYRAPEVFQRLARDGEGELIGWDFVDGDLKPFAPDADCPTPATCAIADTRWQASPARLLLGEAGASRLIVLRTRDGDRGALASAIAFAARSPARIVPMLARNSGADGATGGPDWPLMIEAARRFSNLLFIVPALGPQIDVPGFDNLPLGNLLIVAPATATGENTVDDVGVARPDADIAARVEAPDAAAGTVPRERRAALAAARVAALAARLLAVDPILDAHGLKRKILALAQPLPATAKGLARAGWLDDPRRYFWPE